MCMVDIPEAVPHKTEQHLKGRDKYISRNKTVRRAEVMVC
jgi:hypothetical protein